MRPLIFRFFRILKDSMKVIITCLETLWKTIVTKQFVAIFLKLHVPTLTKHKSNINNIFSGAELTWNGAKWKSAPFKEFGLPVSSSDWRSPSLWLPKIFLKCRLLPALSLKASTYDVMEVLVTMARVTCTSLTAPLMLKDIHTGIGTNYVFFRDVPDYSSREMPIHIVCVLQSGFEVKDFGY